MPRAAIAEATGYLDAVDVGIVWDPPWSPALMDEEDEATTTEPVGFLAVNGHEIGCDLALDVRDMAVLRRHWTIFTEYGALVPGAGFVLVKSHDPESVTTM